MNKTKNINKLDELYRLKGIIGNIYHKEKEKARNSLIISSTIPAKSKTLKNKNLILISSKPIRRK